VEFAPPALTRIDSQLTLAQQSYDWLTEECETASQTLRESIDDYEGDWWTHDGWDRFNDAQTTSPALDDAIETAWDSFQAETEFDAFVDELQEHPWIQPASEFGSNVRPAFESKYITPLRRAASWHEDISDAVSTVIGGTTHTEADGFIRATNTLLDSEPLAVVADSDIDGLRDTFEELQTLVGDQSPQTSRRLGFSRRIANRWTRNWNDSSNATTSVSSGLKRGNHPMTTKRPFHDFTERLAQFADGRRGIRNPFVIVPVQPKYERRVAERLTEWATNPHRTEEFPDDGTVQVLRLDELFVETDVFELAVDLGENSQPATITETMQDRLAEELVAIMVEKSTHQPSSDTSFSSRISGVSTRSRVRQNCSTNSTAATSSLRSAFRSPEISTVGN